MKAISFFNNKGGVGKTSLVYHLAWMYSDMDWRVLAVDLDPQANLTAMFVEDDHIEELWDHRGGSTVFEALEPLLEGTGDVGSPHVEPIHYNLGLIAGSLKLASAEGEFASQWSAALDKSKRAFRVETSFWRIAQAGAQAFGADIILIDLGPNLGSINRAGLLAADYIVSPLAPDLFSMQGLKNLGPTLRSWRDEWKQRREKASEIPLDFIIPEGRFLSGGYVLMQHAIRESRPTVAYEKWMQKIAPVYAETLGQDGLVHEEDRLGVIKHYRSLMPMAMQARKPIFHLKAGDGAIGAHYTGVQKCYSDFEKLAMTIAERCHLEKGQAAQSRLI